MIEPVCRGMHVDISVVSTVDSRSIVRATVVPCRVRQPIVPIPCVHTDIVTFEVWPPNVRSEK